MIHIRTIPNYDADLIVVGGGPAGAAAATFAARAGMKVVLLDRQVFPRDKVCGDFVGPAALLELKELGITAQTEYRKSNIIRSAALFADGEQLIEQAIPEVDGMPAHGRVIPRQRLDAWLVDAARLAGAVILERHRVIDLEIGEDCVRLQAGTPSGVQRFSARLLLGADGSDSVVARLLRGCRPTAADRVIAVRAYFQGVEGAEDRADLYFSGDSFPGYYWAFPTGGGGANVGVGMALETFPGGPEQLKELLSRLIQKDPKLRQRLGSAQLQTPIVGWPLTTYNPNLPVTGDRVLLAGDAAGLINPLNGEGIQYALQSGHWAAEAALACMRAARFDADALEPYARRIETAFRYDMALAAFIVQAIRNRTLTPVWMLMLRFITSRARHDREYARIVGGILAGLVPANKGLSWRVIGGTAEQAALSTAWKMTVRLLGGPRSLLQFGSENLRTILHLMGESAAHPAEVFQWSARLAAHAVELGSQASLHGAAALLQRAGPKRPSSQITLDHVQHHVADEPLVLRVGNGAISDDKLAQRRSRQLART